MSNAERIIFWLAILFLLLSGCQKTTKIYIGAKADAGSVLSGEVLSVRDAVWQDLYVQLEYSFKRQGEKLLLEGTWGFADHPRMMFAKVKEFELKLFLLDQENRVLDYVTFSRSIGGYFHDRLAFKKELVLPKGAAASSIGYEGTLIGEKGELKSVWKLPRRSR
ncbi:hypothetical protein [Malonomonas rubra]|uniref:hypothetical protein n=1 Tax=Malonomonas rubra TaxID=57040 RepID=UPI0026EA61AA|nr:hypothetical protein [Malonomonas rubra]